LPVFESSKSDVEKMEAKRDVNGLIKALAYRKDALVRQRAAEALGEIGDARAVDAMW
jgi:HEAT repeat protein